MPETNLRLMSFALAAVLCLPSVSVSGQERSSNPGRTTAKTAAKTETQPVRTSVAAKLTTEQEVAALKFANQHHGELGKLLEQLQRSSPQGFASGIREVHTALMKLDRVREKQPHRYQAELQNWKLDSEIRLLTARWVISKDPTLEGQIREMLRERQQARIDRLMAERDRLAERLQLLDQQIGMGTAELEADLEAEWDRLSKRVAASATSHKRPSRKPSETKTP